MRFVGLGRLDIAVDLGTSGGEQETLFAHSFFVVASRAAGKSVPSDGVPALIDDDGGLRWEAEAARRLGFFGKSAIHPRQLPIINEVFMTSPEEVLWAERVLVAFDDSGGAALQVGRWGICGQGGG